MKKILILLIVSSFTFATHAQSRKERKAEKEAQREAEYKSTKDLIASGNYEFIAERAFPLGNDIARLNLIPNNQFQGNTVFLSGDSNFVKIKSDSTHVSLPFFGRAFRASIGSDPDLGFKYEGGIEDYEVKQKDIKRKLIINFEGKKNNDFMQFNLTVGALSAARLTVTSNNRQSITYQGYIRPIKAEDTKEN